MTLTPVTLKRIVTSALNACSDEIGCDECFEQLDRKLWKPEIVRAFHRRL